MARRHRQLSFGVLRSSYRDLGIGCLDRPFGGPGRERRKDFNQTKQDDSLEAPIQRVVGAFGGQGVLVVLEVHPMMS